MGVHPELRVTRARRLAFDAEAGADEVDPELAGFVRDMVRPYGNPLRDDLLARPTGHAYADMAEALLAELVPADEPVDLLVLMSGIHDIQLARPSATYLSYICPGKPLSFAICDQGTAAGFTGLRLVRDYTAAGDSGRALLVVAEQPVLHYEPYLVDGAAAPVPERAAVVGFLCDANGSATVGPVRQRVRVAAADAGRVLAAEVAELAAGRDRTLLVGPSLADAVRDLPDDAVAAPAGQPFTGVWWELAGQLADPTAPPGLTVLADFDPSLGYLCLATVDLAPALVPEPVGAHRGSGR